MKLPLKVRQIGGGGHCANQVYVCDADKCHVATVHPGVDIPVMRAMKHEAITEAKKANAEAIVEAFAIIKAIDDLPDPVIPDHLSNRIANLTKGKR
jgi:hypothetical protein